MTQKGELNTECRRLEEDVLFTEKGHFSAAARLRAVHMALGVLATIGATMAGAEVFSGELGTAVGGIAGVVSAVASALMTFAKPQELADTHHKVGTRYAALRGRLRRYRELDLIQPENEVGDQRQALEALADQKSELDTAGPAIPRYAFVGARKSIEAGEADYRENKHTRQ